MRAMHAVQSINYVVEQQLEDWRDTNKKTDCDFLLLSKCIFKR